MINETISNIINAGFEAHYRVHGHYPSESDAVIWGIASLTEGRLSPGELKGLLADYFYLG